ncbi:DUF2834 domain-containing protein [Tropicibacter naphthalenivorans]|uniref:K+-transporting ATPase, A chain n=1 Tax=Tropicibacter naphthalenivorans TaxID=441103 RepID=A0A0P1GEQ9_9RHOB|nr:DUF2834 domain-containing protein [Tropicibacter naphthalenivorans]CUH79856.1 hypothetical protein TRN7648_02681 [Tropicibacter naphthalenivorans]SMC75694.1 Protein of unknown function [Tropicibacter naphthalenivorans]
MLRLVWLSLALWGAVHPMYYFSQHLISTGWDFQALIDAWYVNDSTTGLTWDLTIAAITLTIWVLAEVAVRRNWLTLIAIPATFCIGVSCGLPLYLYLRSRPI